MSIDKIIAGLCSSQHGVAARRQLLENGIHRNHIHVRLRRGQIEEATDRVIRLSGSPATSKQELMIAVLHTGKGAFVSHNSAAWLWNIPGYRRRPLTVSILRDRRVEIDDVCSVRHATFIPDGSIKRVEGIPVSSPALALFQLAGNVSQSRLANAVDRAWSMRLTSGTELDSMLDRLAKSGRNGIVNMREVLEERGHDYRPPQSGLEQRVLGLLQTAGWNVRCQVDLGNYEEWTGRVDFLIDELSLVIEVQSERYHTSLSDSQRDRIRREKLTAAGFNVLEVWDSDVFHKPRAVIEQVRTAAAGSPAGSSAAGAR